MPLLSCKQSLARLGSREPHGALRTSTPASATAATRTAAVAAAVAAAAAAVTAAAVVADSGGLLAAWAALGMGEPAERGAACNRAAPDASCWPWQVLLLLLLLLILQPLLEVSSGLAAAVGASLGPKASSKFPRPETGRGMEPLAAALLPKRLAGAADAVPAGANGAGDAGSSAEEAVAVAGSQQLVWEALPLVAPSVVLGAFAAATCCCPCSHWGE